MSALGQKRPFAVQKGMSAIPPKADVRSAPAYVRFVPKADMRPLALAALFEQSESATQRICCRFALV
jgi:hypothetical protein